MFLSSVALLSLSLFAYVFLATTNCSIVALGTLILPPSSNQKKELAALSMRAASLRTAMFRTTGDRGALAISKYLNTPGKHHNLGLASSTNTHDALPGLKDSARQRFLKKVIK